MTMKSTAIIFGDFQTLIRDIVESRAGQDGSKRFDEACVHASKLLSFARQLKAEGKPAHIFHVVVDESAGKPRKEEAYVTLPGERDPSSQRAALRTMTEQFQTRYKGEIGIVDQLKPKEGEAVMGRPTANAFFDTDLTNELRSLNVEQMVICGVATSGIVLASMQGAIERGLAVTVAEDSCMDFGEMHMHIMHYIAKRSKVMQIASLSDHHALEQALVE